MNARHIIGALGAVPLLFISSSVLATAVPGQGTWETTLQGRDLDSNLTTVEAYYDSALNITWLADGNYATSSGYAISGWMNWAAANAWAASLDPYGSGITGWRLPDTIDVGNDGVTYTNLFQGVDAGFNITTHSEMSHMFYVTLGNTAVFNTSGVRVGCPAPSYCLVNTGPFSNVWLPSYWSATEYAPSTNDAWYFSFEGGHQSAFSKTNGSWAWAVHAGDVGAPAVSVPAVPVPAAFWLFGSGLIGLFGFARRRRAV
jgi:hypothetical protein